MKRKILGMLFCLIAFAVYADAPAFDDGVVIKSDNTTNITLMNYSALNEIDIEFCVYKDSDWVSAGKITECPFGKEVLLSSKESLNKTDYIAYKCKLPADKKFYIDSKGSRLTFYLLEASNVAFKSQDSFAGIKEDPANGLYKFDTMKEKKRYENEVRVKNAPRCIIMFQRPKSTIWEVYGTASGDKIKVKTSYHKDIDRCDPYWIISICEDHKDYAIAAYTKHNDLCFEFSNLTRTEIEVPNAEPAESVDDVEAQLVKLKQLYDDGLIDEDEYKEKKSKVLGL